MFYYTLRRIVRIYLRLYFKKIYFNKIDAIQDDTPVLIACNHNSAFADALILGSFLSKLELHFIVRGDVFNKKMLWFFRLTNQIPIFRFRDGYENMKRNNDTMEYCYKALSDKNRIIIFSEGDCSVKMRLRTIQKGTARMAFGAYEKYKISELLIYPVGLNYIEPTKMRSSVLIHMGDPIRVSEYFKTYDENPNKAIKELTDEIQRRMTDHVISIKDEQTHDIARHAVEFLDNSVQAPLLALKENRSMFNKIHHWVNLHNSYIKKGDQTWVDNLKKMHKGFKKGHLKTRLPLFSENLTTQSILALILAPVGIPAVLYFSIPHLLGKKIVKKLNVSPEFTMSIRIAVSFAILMIQLLLTFLLLGILTKWKFAIFFLILATFITKLGQIWWHSIHLVIQKYNWHRIKENKHHHLFSLLKELELVK